MKPLYAYLAIAFLFLIKEVRSQTFDDTLIGVADNILMKVNKNTGQAVPWQAVNGLGPSQGVNKLTWCEPNQCFYTISQSFPPELGKINLNGDYTNLGVPTISSGTVFMCEAIAYDRTNDELYVAASLDGSPPSNYSSESILRVDTNTLNTTLVGTFNPGVEADAMTIGDNGVLYFFDGQPGQFARFYSQDLSFAAAAQIIWSSNYFPSRGLTVKGNDFFFSQDRELKKINTTSLAQSNVGNMFTPSDFNGELLNGLTWYSPCPTTALFGEDTTLCSGNPINLVPSINGLTYTWQDGNNNSSHNANSTGLYWVEVTTENCVYRDSIFVNYTPSPNINLGTDTNICSGNTIVLDASSAQGSYQWQNGSTQETFEASEGGTYWVEVIENGCASRDSIYINEQKIPSVELGDDILRCQGKSVRVSVGDADGYVLWSNGSSEPSIVVDEDGLFTVEVNNTCGSDFDTISVTSEECFCTVYLPNTITPNDDEHNQYFKPSFDCAIYNYSMQVYNRWGQLIFESKDPNEHWDATMDGKQVQDAIYTFRLQYSSEEELERVLIGHVGVLR